ncbi:uncharacterized protein HD556DRAFT_1500557 [Suillus plorans]|uniref:Heterokaryon incompatibility domain-containing protein n=1 Tax=Suillus plorans TaxID=116603 RepID=A0A9P7DBX8_9AGAM|nr:uncharacterized protein HD556DRAFT_1500557 [Suillus plorans]KAG1787812.1 hypothetical protein HD556DRAFT_1500557 [Suillus plorans]
MVDSASSAEPYIAISYVWDTRPSFKEWEGRRVTEQALHIADRFSKHTSYALWIDAICIDQDNEPVKMVELVKMADIYRGAPAVLFLVPEIDQTTSRVVEHGTGMIDLDVFHALEHAGDTHGIRRAVTPKKDNLLGQLSSFRDSVHSMSNAMKVSMPLGTAVSSAWRRQSAVIHDMAYSLLVEKVFADLVDKASLKGDFSWLRWSHLVDRDGTCEGMSMVPVPATVLATPASAITEWRFVEVPEIWQSQPEDIKGIIKMLQKLSYGSENIWNLLFGLHVGLACDVDRAVGGSGLQNVRDLASLGESADVRTYNELTVLLYGSKKTRNVHGSADGLADVPDRPFQRRPPGLAQALLNLTTGYIDGTFKLEDSEDDLYQSTMQQRPTSGNRRELGFCSYKCVDFVMAVCNFNDMAIMNYKTSVTLMN